MNHKGNVFHIVQAAYRRLLARWWASMERRAADLDAQATALEAKTRAANERYIAHLEAEQQDINRRIAALHIRIEEVRAQ